MRLTASRAWLCNASPLCWACATALLTWHACCSICQPQQTVRVQVSLNLLQHPLRCGCTGVTCQAAIWKVFSRKHCICLLWNSEVRFHIQKLRGLENYHSVCHISASCCCAWLRMAEAGTLRPSAGGCSPLWLSCQQTWWP